MGSIAPQQSKRLTVGKQSQAQAQDSFRAPASYVQPQQQPLARYSSLAPKSTIEIPDPAAQLRSALAIGHLIAAKTPSAGSRLISQELKQLSSTLTQELTALRKDINQLPNKFASVIKSVLEEERNEQRPNSGRRNFLSSMNPRRLPIFRRPRRISLMFARKSAPSPFVPSRLADASTNTSPAGAAGAAAKTTASKTAANQLTSKATKGQTEQVGSQPQIQPASKLAPQQPTDPRTQGTKTTVDTDQSRQSQQPPNDSPQVQAAADAARFALSTVFKHIWLPPLETGTNGYEGEADTDSSDTPPNSPP